MELQTANEQASFYCNRCDKWVDGIDDPANQQQTAGFKQVLCDECGSAIPYRLPSFWKRLQRRASELLTQTLGSTKK
jgi:hypothetical protein